MEQFDEALETLWVQNGGINLEVKILGQGPVVLCVHGWPELWYSYRHQLKHFAARGYRVAAMNVRGYGGNSAPEEIPAYTLEALSDDVASVIAALRIESLCVIRDIQFGAGRLLNKLNFC